MGARRWLGGALGLLLIGLPPAGRAEERPVIALVGGMLLDGRSAPVHHATLVIRGDRIAAAGPSSQVAVPEGAVVLDTRGRTVLPGLIDAHIHLDLLGHGSYERYYEFVKAHSSYPEIMRIAAAQLLRAGVTSAIDLGAPLSILGVREEIERGRIPGPRLSVSGPWITRRRYEGGGEFEQYLVGSTQEARAAASDLIAKGADVIKTWEGLTPEDYAAIVEVAHAHGRKVHAHLYEPEAVRAALDAGVDVLQHMGSAGMPPYAPELVAEVVRRRLPVVQTISHRIWIYPATLAFPERLDDPELARSMPAPIYAELQRSFADFRQLAYFSEIELETRNAQQSAGQFIEAGATLGVGTDAASPLNFHTQAMWREMAALVEVGMTPRQVIEAATRVNAAILGREAELGTLEPGKLADLLVVEGSPLLDIRALARVSFVVKDGIPWYDAGRPSGDLARVGRPF